MGRMMGRARDTERAENREQAKEAVNWKKDHLRTVLCLLCCALLCLLCAGCGRPTSEEPDLEADGNAGTVEEAENREEDGHPFPIATAPLLSWEDPDNENLADMLQRECGGLMVRLTAGRLQGSGVLYCTSEENLVILTAAHVFANSPESVKITFGDGWELESSDFVIAENADAAMIQVSLEKIPEEHRERYLCANVDKKSFDALAAGDGCIVMGSRTGVAAEAYEGIVLEPWIYMEDYGQYMMWVRGEGMPGMSGGGLFDRQGHFLGILSGGNGDGELAVVPLGLILAAFFADQVF